MEPNPEKRVLESEGIDRISDLPDPILEKILSFLPTKNAVATSILSTRWKNLSPFVVLPIKLNLDDSLRLHPEGNESDKSPSVSFMDFVDKLFNVTLSNVHCVESVDLTCFKNYGDAKIVSWVCSALRLNVRHLSLAFSLTESNDTYSLFAGLNGCTTLVTLMLVLDAVLCLPDNFSLPNLKSLHLWGVTLNDREYEDFLTELIEGCPGLEDLRLTYCDLKNLDYFSIESAQLKKLIIEECFAEHVLEFTLDAPNLEVLILNKYFAWGYYVSKLESLRVAHINVGPSQYQVDDGYSYEDDGTWRFVDCVPELVTACSNTTFLYLAACSINALCDSSIQLPVFQNLTSLVLGHIGVDGWTSLACFLENAPNLEKLMFKEGFTEDEEGFANFQKSLPVSPACLELHTKIIEFLQFKGDEDEMKLVEYFWKNGGVLQKIVLYWPPPDDISILMRLEMLSRQSNTREIECRWKERVHM